MRCGLLLSQNGSAQKLLNLEAPPSQPQIVCPNLPGLEKQIFVLVPVGVHVLNVFLGPPDWHDVHVDMSKTIHTADFTPIKTWLTCTSPEVLVYKNYVFHAQVFERFFILRDLKVATSFSEFRETRPVPKEFLSQSFLLPGCKTFKGRTGTGMRLVMGILLSCWFAHHERLLPTRLLRLLCHQVLHFKHCSWETKVGWKTQGRGKHTIEPLPIKVLDPHTYDTFPPPPFVHALSFSLEETGADQTNPTFRGLQNWLWRAHSIVCSQAKSHGTFPPHGLGCFPDLLPQIASWWGFGLTNAASCSSFEVALSKKRRLTSTKAAGGRTLPLSILSKREDKNKGKQREKDG